MHFFNPVPKMKLVEIVRALDTSEDAIAVTTAGGPAHGQGDGAGARVARLHHLAHQRHDRERGLPDAAGRRRHRGGHRQGAEARPQPSHGPLRDGGPRRARHPPGRPRVPAQEPGREVQAGAAARPARQGGPARQEGRPRRLRLRRDADGLPQPDPRRWTAAGGHPHRQPARRAQRPRHRAPSQEFHRALDEVRKARSTVLIVTGAGDKAFVSGADINAIRAAHPRRRPGLHQLAADDRHRGPRRGQHRRRQRLRAGRRVRAGAGLRPAHRGRRTPSSACPSPRSGSSPARAGRSACRASSASGAPRR